MKDFKPLIKAPSRKKIENKHIIDTKLTKQKRSKKTRGEMVRSIDDEKSFTVNATMWKGQKSSYVKAQEINPFRPCEPREVKKDTLCHHFADATDINGHTVLASTLINNPDGLLFNNDETLKDSNTCLAACDNEK